MSSHRLDWRAGVPFSLPTAGWFPLSFPGAVAMPQCHGGRSACGREEHSLPLTCLSPPTSRACATPPKHSYTVGTREGVRAPPYCQRSRRNNVLLALLPLPFPSSPPQAQELPTNVIS